MTWVIIFLGWIRPNLRPHCLLTWDWNDSDLKLVSLKRQCSENQATLTQEIMSEQPLFLLYAWIQGCCFFWSNNLPRIAFDDLLVWLNLAHLQYVFALWCSRQSIGITFQNRHKLLPTTGSLYVWASVMSHKDIQPGKWICYFLQNVIWKWCLISFKALCSVSL